jgi:Leucine-rich repeat (LRR) protein
LSKLHNLAHLGLWSNPITDYKSLCNLKKLTELSLNKARINDAEIQALREALPNCEISLW